jgi:hypothetical protein
LLQPTTHSYCASTRSGSGGIELENSVTAVGQRRAPDGPVTRYGSWIAFWLLAAAVSLSPLPFGTVDLPVIACWAVVLGLALLFAIPAIQTRVQVRVLLIGVVVLALWATILIQQMSPTMFLPGAHPNGIWPEAARLLDTPLQETITIAANQPFFALGAPLLTFLAFFTSFVICDARKGRLLIQVIAYSGLVYAVYGIAAFIVDPVHVLWFEKEAYRTVLTATFINRNTAAVYFGAVGAVWLLLICERLRSKQSRHAFEWRLIFFDGLLRPSSRTLFHYAALIGVIAAMFMTGSRAGTIISLGGLVFASIFFFRPDLSGWRLWLTLLALPTLALVCVELFAPGVSNRFEVRGLTDLGRLETYRSTLKIIADHSLYGTGLGTFAWIIPSYRSADISVWGTWDRAHNTVLEVASDLGLVATGMLLLCWFVVLLAIWRSPPFRAGRIVTVAGLTIAVVGALHSLVDFSLQIPGYAILLASALGASFASATMAAPGLQTGKGEINAYRELSMQTRR